MSEWKPISSAPRDKKILVANFDDEYPSIEACEWGHGAWRYADGEYVIYRPTYWMPIPPPPEVEG